MAASTASKFGVIGGTLAPGVYTFQTSLPPESAEYFGFLKAENAGGSTVSAVIEHSPDGENWFSVYTLTTAGNAVDLDSSVQLLMSKLRATITVGGAAADVTCQMWFDPGSKR